MTNKSLGRILQGVNALAVNPSTGLLESDNRRAFTSDEKLELIRLAQECIDRKEAPNLKAITAKVGVTMRTFWNHIDQDSEFRGMWDEIRFQVEDILSQSLVNLGQKANGVGACAFWLKNRVPERWSDNPQVNQFNYDIAWIKNAMNVVKSAAIDAVVVDKDVITSTPSNQVDKTTNVSDVK